MTACDGCCRDTCNVAVWLWSRSDTASLLQRNRSGLNDSKLSDSITAGSVHSRSRFPWNAKALVRSRVDLVLQIGYTDKRASGKLPNVKSILLKNQQF